MRELVKLTEYLYTFYPLFSISLSLSISQANFVEEVRVGTTLGESMKLFRAGYALHVEPILDGNYERF